MKDLFVSFTALKRGHASLASGWMVVECCAPPKTTADIYELIERIKRARDYIDVVPITWHEVN